RPARKALPGAAVGLPALPACDLRAAARRQPAQVEGMVFPAVGRDAHHAVHGHLRPLCDPPRRDPAALPRTTAGRRRGHRQRRRPRPAAPARGEHLMTPPGPAARHDGGADARSPFTGSDVCAAAGLPAYLDVRDTRLDFTTITDPRRRLVAKEYIYARLAPADPLVAVLPRAYRIPLTLRTCGKRLIEAASWMNWLTGQQIASLGQVTQDHCDRYLIERGRRKDASGTVIGTLD